MNVAIDASKIERCDDEDDDDDDDVEREIATSKLNGDNENSKHTKKYSKRKKVRDWFKRGMRRMFTSSTSLAQTITKRELRVLEKGYDHVVYINIYIYMLLFFMTFLHT